ncbi:MAG: ComEC/Rec2 family competence protein [Campylobacterales bacterium]|nr:ComEC/Rec2 family competence protein [Campylobacterales bacterium]
MKLEKVHLFSNKREILFFGFISLFILSYSLLIEYQHYKQLSRFDSAITDAKVLKQYIKTKNSKTYQVLKLKSDDGFTFYTTASKSFQDVTGKKLRLEIFPKELTFYKFLTQFYAFSYVLEIDENSSIKNKLNSYIDAAHDDKDIASIYKALYSAEGLEYELQRVFSSLGVSHLLAISGFHLGVLATVFYFIITPIYRFFQDRYFPYRNSKTDIFIPISIILFSYLLFLEAPPSLLRAFCMLIIAFLLYDRHIDVLSMQTLLITVIVILIFFPKLFFSIGFWLSVAGVFYIFLFLKEFEDMGKIKTFLLLPIFVYLTMLPYSVVIFGGFSIYHPLSIIWTTLFSIFYPLSILVHLIGFGDILVPLLQTLISLDSSNHKLQISYTYLYIHIILSFLALYKKLFFWVLIFYSLFVLSLSLLSLYPN